MQYEGAGVLVDPGRWLRCVDVKETVLAIPRQLRLRHTAPVSAPRPVSAVTGICRAERPLRSNVLWSVLGNVVYAGCQWATLLIVAKLCVMETLGQFVLAMASTGPLLTFSMLALRAVLVTDANREHRFSDYVWLRTGTSVAAVLAIGCMALLFPSADQGRLLVAVGLAGSVDALSDILHGRLQQMERMDWVALVLMLKGSSVLTATSLVLLGGGTIAAAVLWGVVTRIAILVLLEAPRVIRCSRDEAREDPGRCRCVPDRRERTTLRRLASLAILTLPLGAVTMLVSLNINVPRYFVGHCVGARALAAFGAMTHVMFVGTTVVAAIGQASSPRLARYFAMGDFQGFRELLARLLGLGGVIGAAGVLMSVANGSALLGWVYTREYVAYADSFVWVMLAAAVSYCAALLGFAMTSVRCFKLQVPLHVSVIATATITSWLLIPRLGLQGAAISLLCTSAVQAIGSGVAVTWSLRKRAAAIPA